MDLEAVSGSERIRADPAGSASRFDRPAERRDGVRVFGADIDEAVSRAHGMAGDGQPLQERERVALHEHPVGEGARVALVGVGADEPPVRRCRRNSAPLEARREARAATPPQPRGHDLLDHLIGGQGQRPGKPAPSAQARVVVFGGRVHDPQPGRRHPGLPGQPGVLVDDPQVCRPASLRGRPGTRRDVERGEGVVGGDPRDADAGALVGGLDLDEGFEPQHPARAGADHVHAWCRREGLGDLVGTGRHRGRVAGDVDPGHGRSPARRRSATRSEVSRPYSRPSTVPLGPSAQLPRQKTSASSMSLAGRPASSQRTSATSPSAPTA